MYSDVDLIWHDTRCVETGDGRGHHFLLLARTEAKISRMWALHSCACGIICNQSLLSGDWMAPYKEPTSRNHNLSALNNQPSIIGLTSNLKPPDSLTELLLWMMKCPTGKNFRTFSTWRRTRMMMRSECELWEAAKAWLGVRMKVTQSFCLRFSLKKRSATQKS